MNTTENNKLIAEFMGLITEEGKYLAPPIDELSTIGMGLYVSLDEMRYHTSWDWLMPVVEEIDHLEYESERLDKIEMAIKTRQINAVHKAVVEFIKWYNENK